MQGYEKLQYIGYNLKKDSKGRWLLLAQFRGSSGHYDWAPKWAAELDKLYASAYLVELLNGGHTLKGFKQIYEMLNEGMIEALKKAETQEVDKQEIEQLRLKLHNEIERLNQNWRQVIEQAPEDVRRTPAIAILRSAGTKPIAIEGDTAILAFRYPIHKEKMEAAENQQVAEKIISNFLGHPCHVRCIYEPEDNHLLKAALKMGAQVTSVEEK
jgi:hypothetical protein